MTFNPISTECELSVMYRILLGHWETFRIKKKKKKQSAGLCNLAQSQQAVSSFRESTQFPKAVIYPYAAIYPNVSRGATSLSTRDHLDKAQVPFRTLPVLLHGSGCFDVDGSLPLRSATAWQTDVCDTVGASHFPDFSEHAQSLDSFIHLAWQPSTSTDTKGVEALLKPP